jgi:hypothetical protein
MLVLLFIGEANRLISIGRFVEALTCLENASCCRDVAPSHIMTIIEIRKELVAEFWRSR